MTQDQYKIGFKSDREREKKYYEMVLQPFVKAISQDSNVNILKLVKKITTRTDDYVPKYIFYLLDIKDSENLKKVLLYDYFDIYENDINTIVYIFRVMGKILTYFKVFVVILLLYAGCSSILAGIVEIFFLIDNNTSQDIIKNGITLSRAEWSLLEIVMGIICIFVAYMAVVFIKHMSMDRYKIGRKQIKKIIKSDVAYYNRHGKNLIY